MKKLTEVSGHKDLKRDPDSGKIYVRMFRQARKKELFKSTRTDNLREARKIADVLIQDYLGLKPKTSQIKLIEDLWVEYLETKSDKSLATIDSIKNSGKHLIPFFGQNLPAEISSEYWEKYISVKRKNSPDRRFFNDWKWFGMFLGYLRENRYIDRKPKLRNPDPKRTESGKVYSTDEVSRLLSNSNADLRLHILMGYTMGMRIGEILNLTWDRVDMVKQVVHLRAQDTKIRRARSFKLSKEVFELLGNCPSRTGPVFPSPRDPGKTVGRSGNKSAWKTCKRVSNVVGRFHDLRHSFLTRAFKSSKGKVDLMLICEYAGLSIEQAQETYLHFTHEDTGVVAELVVLNNGSGEIGDVL